MPYFTRVTPADYFSGSTGTAGDVTKFVQSLNSSPSPSYGIEIDGNLLIIALAGFGLLALFGLLAFMWKEKC